MLILRLNPSFAREFGILPHIPLTKWGRQLCHHEQPRALSGPQNDEWEPRPSESVGQAGSPPLQRTERHCSGKLPACHYCVSGGYVIGTQVERFCRVRIAQFRLKTDSHGFDGFLLSACRQLQRRFNVKAQRHNAGATRKLSHVMVFALFAPSRFNPPPSLLPLR